MMFGIGGDPFGGQQQEQFGGPLGDIEQQVSGVLNSADQHRIYIPAGPGGIITVPRPRALGGYRTASPVSPGGPRTQSTGSRGWTAVVFLIMLAALVAVAVTVLVISGR
jgi:hypothetical protein